ncbi:MAG TPA: EamA family transporter [Flexilinea sp.]|nr:EamA family transporter [Flexilinea sp.]HNY19748.1 EamA family transporter [Flexilinea sp.]HPS48142.1 EamA family transporter [Flexilinea sp.]
METFWPIILIVISNIFYNITTKSTPTDANPFLSLTVTYLVGAILTFLMFWATATEKGLSSNISRLNWTGYCLGIIIVGLETGYIYLYRAGWNISLGSLVANILLAISLVIIGALFYHEKISARQLIGMFFCIIGLIFVNKK